jgi:glycosyltransferase involved in cell wall biosynthesis
VAGAEQTGKIREELTPFCDESLLLESPIAVSSAKQVLHGAKSVLYSCLTGLKRSNYQIGRVLFTPEAVETATRGRQFDLALFEYWHAARATRVLQNRRIPCVVDIHNILSRNYGNYLDRLQGVPQLWKRWASERYGRAEKTAWRSFDGIITMNSKEEGEVRGIVGEATPMFSAPMGTDLSAFPYSWDPAQPPRVAYYGSLGSAGNQRDAIACASEIMPIVWQRFPEAELWLIGSNPPERIRALTADARVHVPGFVEHVQETLRRATVVVVPWSGMHGFRSRLIEVMALGVPLATTPEVIAEMDLDRERGVMLGHNNMELADLCSTVLANPTFARQRSTGGHAEVLARYDLDATYGRLARDLREFCLQGGPRVARAADLNQFIARA